MKHGDGECGAVAGATPQHPQPAPTTTATPTTTVPDEKLEPVKAEPVVKIEPVVPVVKLEPCTAAGTVVVADETEDDEGADGEYESLRGPSRSQLRYPFVRVKGSAPRHYASFGMRDHAGKHTRDPRTLERGSRVTVTKARMEPLTVTVIGAVRFGVTVYVVVVVDANVSAPFLLPPRAITSVTPPSAPASVDDHAAAAAISMLQCILDRPENAAMMDGLPFERKKKTTPISTPIKRTSKAVTTAKKPRTPKRKSLSGRNVDAKHANNDIDSDDEDDDDDDDGGDKENKQPNRRATPRKPRKKRSRNDDVGAVAVTAQPAPAVAGIDGLVASLQSFRLIAQAFGELKSVIVGI